MSADIRTSAINMPTSLREELACNQFNDQVGSQLHRGHDRGPKRASPAIASADNDCTKDGDVFAQAQLHFPAVAQMVGLGLRNWKMLYLLAGID